MEGKCSKGDACTFSHSLTPNRTPADVRSEHTRLLSLPPQDLLRLADDQGKGLWETLTAGVCKFRMGASGLCSKGDACLYSHDLHLIPCRYWHAWGRCSSGTNCRFSHERLSEILKEQIRKEAHEAVQKERASGRKRKSDESCENADDNLDVDFESELALNK